MTEFVTPEQLITALRSMASKFWTMDEEEQQELQVIQDVSPLDCPAVPPVCLITLDGQVVDHDRFVRLGDSFEKQKNNVVRAVSSKYNMLRPAGTPYQLLVAVQHRFMVPQATPSVKHLEHVMSEYFGVFGKTGLPATLTRQEVAVKLYDSFNGLKLREYLEEMERLNDDNYITDVMRKCKGMIKSNELLRSRPGFYETGAGVKARLVYNVHKASYLLNKPWADPYKAHTTNVLNSTVFYLSIDGLNRTGPGIPVRIYVSDHMNADILDDWIERVTSVTGIHVHNSTDDTYYVYVRSPGLFTTAASDLKSCDFSMGEAMQNIWHSKMKQYFPDFSEEIDLLLSISKAPTQYSWYNNGQKLTITTPSKAMTRSGVISTAIQGRDGAIAAILASFDALGKYRYLDTFTGVQAGTKFEEIFCAIHKHLGLTLEFEEGSFRHSHHTYLSCVPHFVLRLGKYVWAPVSATKFCFLKTNPQSIYPGKSFEEASAWYAGAMSYNRMVRRLPEGALIANLYLRYAEKHGVDVEKALRIFIQKNDDYQFNPMYADCEHKVISKEDRLSCLSEQGYSLDAISSYTDALDILRFGSLPIETENAFLHEMGQRHYGGTVT